MNSFSFSKILEVLTNVSLDVAILIVIVAFFVFWGFVKGRDFLLTLIVSIYPSAFLTIIFPFYEKINLSFENKVFLEKFVVFTVFFFIIFFILKKIINSGYEREGIWRIFELIILSMSFSGLLFSILFNTIKILNFYSFGFVFNFLFISNIGFFVWLLFPIFVIFLFIKH